MSYNDLGYLPDQSMSVANLEDTILSHVKEVRKILEEEPFILGVKTQSIYENIINRLEKNRKTYKGVHINNQPLPAFPTNKNS